MIDWTKLAFSLVAVCTLLVPASHTAAAEPDQSADALIEALGSASKARRDRAAQILLDLGRSDPLVDAVVAGIAAQLQSDEPLFGCCRDRPTMDPANRPYVEALLGRLRDSHSDNRVTAARTLGAFADPVAVPALVEAMGDPSAEMREWTVRSLGDIGDETALPALVGALDDRDADVREWAARSLGLIGSDRSVPALVASADDDHVAVREWSVRVLGHLGSEDAVVALMTRLADESRIVRGWSARALIAIAADGA